MGEVAVGEVVGDLGEEDKGSKSRSKSIFFMALAILERTKIKIFVDCNIKNYYSDSIS